MNARSSEVPETAWVEFPGGELEGQPPKALCQECRAKLQALSNGSVSASARRAAQAIFGETRNSTEPRTSVDAAPGRRSRPICFQCYRAEFERQRALKAAGDLDTASEARFQFGLPFEPVNRARLETLRADRAAARAEMQSGPGRFIDKRHHAQIAARHALQQIVAGVSENDAARRSRVLADSAHAAELQLPEAWLPFVVAR
jgi:hypothetical protein